MGIYNFLLGKGVIVVADDLLPVLVDSIPTEFEGDHEDIIYELDLLSEAIERKFGRSYELIKLGHDAFRQIEGGVPQALEGDYEIALSRIQEWRDENEQAEGYHKTDVFFIGTAKELEGLQGEEFSHRVGAPELLYSLPAFLPDIVAYYPVLQKERMPDLEEAFNQPALIWTFAGDCVGCCT